MRSININAWETNQRMGNKPTPVSKNDLGNKSIECVTYSVTKAVIDTNHLLEFVDGTNVVDIMHLEDMVVQGDENLSD